MSTKILHEHPYNIKICLVSEYAYSLLKGDEGCVGGAEVQFVLVAKELVNRFYDVSFLTFEKSLNNYEVMRGIKVYCPFPLDRGISYFNPFNMYKLFYTISKINADIYIQRAGSPLTGLLAFFIRLKKKVFVYSSSSDRNVSDHLYLKSIKDFSRLFYILGVKLSSCVICQSEQQKSMLMENTGKKGKVIKNICSLPVNNKSRKTLEKRVLWIGRIQDIKRPELFLELAKRMPDFKFQMIGAPVKDNLKYYEKIKRGSEGINNLEFLGFISHTIIDTYYENSSVLVSTSSSEGFPNTFLEAWGHSIPVVSLEIDPDGIICKYKLGICSKSFEELVHDTYFMLQNDYLRSKYGDNGRDYLIREHSTNSIISEYEHLFGMLISK